MYFFKYIIFTVVILFNVKVFSLDVTVPLNIYQPLTKISIRKKISIQSIKTNFRNIKLNKKNYLLLDNKFNLG